MSDNLQDHPEYRGLLAAVKATPADDLPRLVLADWIEEHGDPDWAEFIRVQCEFERNPYRDRIVTDTYTDEDGVRPVCERGLMLLRRAREVWPQVTAWNGLVARPYYRVAPRGRFVLCPDAAPTEPSLGWQYEFRRGFVDRVRCRLTEWMGVSERVARSSLIVRRQPVRRVELTDKRCHGDRLRWDTNPVPSDAPPAHATSDSLQAWLPWSIAAWLADKDRHGHLRSGRLGEQHYWVYPNREAAHAALSAAAIAWAESSAAAGEG